MDNLDRTNVAQAAIAKYVLTKQLRDVSVLGENETLDDFEGLSAAFRERQRTLRVPFLFPLTNLFFQFGPTMLMPSQRHTVEPAPSRPITHEPENARRGALSMTFTSLPCDT